MESNKLLKMVNLITDGLGELGFLFKAVRVPSIGLTVGFDVLENPMELFEIRLNDHHSVIQTAGKKLCYLIVHATNLQYILLK
jgi:hypothetical protein